MAYQTSETRLNIPRLDYSLGSCPNILLEPQRTNLALRSEEFNDAYWAKTGSTITANSTTSPSGIQNADTLTENTAISDHKTFKVFTVTASTTYTLSAYVKKNGRNLVYLFDAYTFRGTIFNLDTLATANIGLGLTNASITSVGNGWYRLSGSVTTSGTLMSLEIGITNSTSSTSYLGNGTSGVFLWGAQLEAGAYATSYIPTTSASVTRNADALSRTNVFTNNLITASGGTWFVELKNNVPLIKDTIARLGLGDTSALNSNGLCITSLATTATRFQIYKIVSGSYNLLHTTTTDNVKITYKWNGATADVFVNGVKVVSATSFTTTNMQFFGNSGIDTPKNINSMALFPTPLTDNQCIALTT